MEALQEDYYKLRNQYCELLDKRLTVSKLEDECRVQVAKLQTRVQSVASDSEVEKCTEVRIVSDGLHEMASNFPAAPKNLMLQLILGDISVILLNREDKVAYKQKYEQFKRLNVVVMFVMSIASLIFGDNIFFSSLVHFMSVWFYFTVTIRELILKSNGSRIKSWWLMHHYCSILITALLLTWPPGDCYLAFKNQFMWFTCVLSFVMLLQFRYQRAKLYRQIAMGKKHHLCVSHDLNNKLANMTVLLGSLIIVYLFQFYNSYTLLKLWLWSPTLNCSHFQVPLLTVLFFVVACMNSSTLFTFMAKMKKHRT